jgi:uncharacterized membrane protein YfcA
VTLAPGVLALLALAAFAAGIVDAIAGGGGLITVPALLAAGLPPHLALGTNKGQSVFGSGASLLRFARAGLVDARRAQVAFPGGVAGALCGAALVLLLRPTVLRPVVLALLVAVAFFMAFRPSLPAVAQKGETSHRRWPVAVRHARGATLLIALAIGAYDGFFGPGTGTFLIVAFALVLGDGLTRASGEAKVVNFASNLAALALFASRGVVVWQVALPMAAAQFAGSTLGAHLAVRRGDAFVRRVVLFVVLALVVKLGRDLLTGR